MCCRRIAVGRSARRSVAFGNGFMIFFGGWMLEGFVFFGVLVAVLLAVGAVLLWCMRD
jgi:predicted membrane protein